MNTCPGRARSSTSSAVISLVVLAIARRSPAARAYMTCPSLASTTIAAADCTRGGAAAAAQGSAAASTASRGGDARETRHSRRLIFWPESSACGSSSGFSSWRRSTLTPVFSAIPPSVSPVLTV